MPCAKFNALSTEPHLILQVALRGRDTNPCKYSSHAGGGVGAKSRLLTPRNPPQPRSNSSALKAERSGMPWGNQSARQNDPLLCRMMETIGATSILTHSLVGGVRIPILARTRW